MLAVFMHSSIIIILIISFFVLYVSCFQTTHFPQDPPQKTVQLVDAPKGSSGSSCSLTSPDDPLPLSGCHPSPSHTRTWLPPVYTSAACSNVPSQGGLPCPLDSSVLLDLGSQSILSFSTTAGSWSCLRMCMVIRLAQCFL